VRSVVVVVARCDGRGMVAVAAGGVVVANRRPWSWLGVVVAVVYRGTAAVAAAGVVVWWSWAWSAAMVVAGGVVVWWSHSHVVVMERWW
jgi:energy-coupling factor transporter transmembrane protein EcfT